MVGRSMSSGQDRESYADTQDRESYTTAPDVGEEITVNGQAAVIVDYEEEGADGWSIDYRLLASGETGVLMRWR